MGVLYLYAITFNLIFVGSYTLLYRAFQASQHLLKSFCGSASSDTGVFSINLT
jgi:hypothetical protein